MVINTLQDWYGETSILNCRSSHVLLANIYRDENEDGTVAYLTTYRFKIVVNAVHDFDIKARNIQVAIVHVRLAWDRQGRRSWDCIGWSTENSDLLNGWGDDTSSSMIYAAACAHMNHKLVEEIIDAYKPKNGNVIELASYRLLQGAPKTGSNPFVPAPSRTNAKEVTNTSVDVSD